MRHRRHTTPIGDYLIVIAENDSLAGLYRDAQRHLPAPEALGPEDPAAGAEVVRQLDEYLAAQRTEFELPLAPRGTDFQRTVWAALRTIPYGEVVSYGQLARELGRPAASRAVGAAVGRNPISIVVPCHRVVGASGGLTGYAGGLEAKRWLLDLEQGRRGELN